MPQKIVLNTHLDDAGTRVCIMGLHRRLVAAGENATLNDWKNYHRYDVAVFMAYDHDMAAARSQNPYIRIGLADPKQSETHHVQTAREADFLLVSSVEQRDVFYRHNRNILVFHMFPPMASINRRHVDKETIIVGYHGNRVHLECMCDTVTPALNALGRRRKLEFWAIYNVEALGRACIGIPDPAVMKVRHIQWVPDIEPGTEVSRCFYTDLCHVDIGIMPNALPLRNRLDALESTARDEPEFMYEPFDHLLRYKASCNAQRLYPFARFGIPVIADFAPSASQFIHDGESGFIVSSAQAWYEALEALAESAALRQRMAGALRARVDRVYDTQIESFLEFCRKPMNTFTVERLIDSSVEDEQRRLARYERPTGPGLMQRLRTRVRRIASNR